MVFDAEGEDLVLRANSDSLALAALAKLEDEAEEGAGVWFIALWMCSVGERSGHGGRGLFVFYSPYGVLLARVRGCRTETDRGADSEASEFSSRAYW